MRDLVILKLGGSILTLKDKNKPVFRTRIISRIIHEIKRAYLQQGFNLIIVHGTGSFGHPPGMKYKLYEGIEADPSKMGLSKSKRQGHLLNQLLWELLEQDNLPAISIPPYPITISSNQKVHSMNLKAIKSTLKINRIPVLFGDEVIDLKQGYSVCSSDQLATYLAVKLKAKSLLFTTDVDGIYDKNPKTNPKANKIDKLSIGTIEKIRSSMKVYNLQDVSGEMSGKLGFLDTSKLSNKITVRIFSGLIKNQVYAALNNQNVGTLITV